MLRAGRVLADGRDEGIDGRVDGTCAGRVVGRSGRFSGGVITIGRSSSYQYPG
jgi:hypothetical protein